MACHAARNALCRIFKGRKACFAARGLLPHIVLLSFFKSTSFMSLAKCNASASGLPVKSSLRTASAISVFCSKVPPAH